MHQISILLVVVGEVGDRRGRIAGETSPPLQAWSQIHLFTTIQSGPAKISFARRNRYTRVRDPLYNTVLRGEDT